MKYRPGPVAGGDAASTRTEGRDHRRGIRRAWAAVALRRAGIDDLVIIEADDGVGGTWRRNIYPGAACDIQSHLYSFSFALNKSWSRTYARQPEILAYLESVADDFDLRRHLMFAPGSAPSAGTPTPGSGTCRWTAAGQTVAR